MTAKPALVLDFDGVIHSYTSGWKGADVIPDPPTPGAREAIRTLRETYRVVVNSSRCHQWGGRSNPELAEEKRDRGGPRYQRQATVSRCRRRPRPTFQRRLAGGVERGCLRRHSLEQEGQCTVRILYIAHHGQMRSNDDEGAIVHALKVLGHDVYRLQENHGRIAPTVSNLDLILFHKWEDTTTLHRLKGKAPRVFWYFDLVDFPSDPTLTRRSQARKDWMEGVLPHVELGFCTDGDWVNTVNSRDATPDDEAQQDKLVWLPQGADERIAGLGCYLASGCPTCNRTWGGCDILFTGIRKGGEQRASFVDEMGSRYGRRFRHIQAGIYGRVLADLIASAKVVVAPDGPVTDCYWSNRVYNTLGFGGFLLHPYCEGLLQHYEPGKDFVFYRSRGELHERLGYFLQDHPTVAEHRRQIAEEGLATTLSRHTYRHRVEVLLKTVKERLG
jgi:hypothetical protein